MIFRYRLKLAYDGTQYIGWQFQPNGVSIQQKIEQTLKIINKDCSPICASGRTDAGVHALGQIAHFTTEQPLDCNRTLFSLNGLLPLDIRILALEPAPNDFHARFHALRKIYHYFVHTNPISDPFNYHYRYHFHYPFNFDLLCTAAQKLCGTHDFKALANSNDRGSASKNSIRTLYRLDIVPITGGFRMEFEGSGFLYKMVRNCVGLILEIARSYRPISDIDKILLHKKRSAAGDCAPPHGLFLNKVFYPQEDSPSSVIHFIEKDLQETQFDQNDLHKL
jgi:tRNA pseudouridine38-40 synthase